MDFYENMDNWNDHFFIEYCGNQVSNTNPFIYVSGYLLKKVGSTTLYLQNLKTITIIFKFDTFSINKMTIHWRDIEVEKCVRVSG